MLTEAQLVALEKAKTEKEAHGEFESEHPGRRPGHVLRRQPQLGLVPLWIAAILAAAVGQHPQELDLLAVEERNDPIIEQIRRRDRGLAIIEQRAPPLLILAKRSRSKTARISPKPSLG